jgi:hypothetical protein
VPTVWTVLWTWRNSCFRPANLQPTHFDRVQPHKNINQLNWQALTLVLESAAVDAAEDDADDDDDDAGADAASAEPVSFLKNS